jgi:hypothetical protein
MTINLCADKVTAPIGGSYLSCLLTLSFKFTWLVALRPTSAITTRVPSLPRWPGPGHCPCPCLCLGLLSLCHCHSSSCHHSSCRLCLGCRHPFAHIFALSPCPCLPLFITPVFAQACHCHSRRVKSPSSSLPHPSYLSPLSTSSPAYFPFRSPSISANMGWRSR